MNLPNFLTMSRFGVGVIIAYFLFLHTFVGNVIAAVFFIVASLTDYYDGYFAKKNGLISDFGKIMDPIADKFMILTIFTVLAMLGMMKWWMVGVIAVREVAVTVSRMQAMLKGRVIAAERAGKIKTVLQIASISFILLFLIADQAAGFSSWFYRYEALSLFYINVLLLITVAWTIGSGVLYFMELKKE